MSRESLFDVAALGVFGGAVAEALGAGEGLGAVEQIANLLLAASEGASAAAGTHIAHQRCQR
jgi:hypothetical protein